MGSSREEPGLGAERAQHIGPSAERRGADQRASGRARTGGCSCATTTRATPRRARRWSSASCRSRASSRAATSAAASRSTTSSRSPRSACSRRSTASTRRARRRSRRFAVPTILGELKRHFRDKGWSVRVPRDLQELAVRVDRVGEQLGRDLGRAPTPTEIAESIGVTAEQVLEAREAAGAYRACRSTARATTTRTPAASPTRSAPRTPASPWPRTPPRSSA